MKAEDVKYIASLISRAMLAYENETELMAIKAEVKELCKKYPLPY
jgi:glycine/serine hydroxymethyltransferase